MMLSELDETQRATYRAKIATLEYPALVSEGLTISQKFGTLLDTRENASADDLPALARTLDFLTFAQAAIADEITERERRNAAIYAPVEAAHAGETWLSLGDVLNAHARGETGDAEIFARLFDGKVCYDHSDHTWYFWRGHYWELDRVNAMGGLVSNEVAAQYLYAAATKRRKRGDETEPETERIVKELQTRAGSLRYKNKIGNVLALAQAQHAIALTGAEWDTDPLKLAVANGVLNLQTGELLPGNPRDYIRTVAPVEWRGLDAPAERWERFLLEIFAEDGELVSFTRRLFGYAITGLSVEHIFPVLWGEGRNGKDTLLESLAYVLGDDLATPVQSEVLLDMGRNPNAATPHLAAMRARRLCWVNETNEGAFLNAGQVKHLTGGGTIVARPLYGKPITFKPQYLLMLITNHKPHANADDFALWQRVLLIPFTQAFVENPHAGNERRRDAKLKATLRGEASGILAWLVRGCLEWQRDGLSAPPSVRAATAEYQDAEDTLGQFIGERCIVAPSVQVKAGELYEAYRTWCTGNGIAAMSGTAFGKRMTRRFEKRTGHENIYIGLGLLG